jgi:DNA-binding NarL/FixJ family response regulator
MSRRIVLADDAYILREGVKLVLEHEGYDVVAQAEDYDGLLEAVEEHAPDVVVTDIRMPPTGTDEGIRAANAIRSDHPEIGVVVLSQYVEPEYALRLLEEGTSGLAYLLKERVADAGVLADAIERVATGESKIDPQVIDALVEDRPPHPPRIGGDGRARCRQVELGDRRDPLPLRAGRGEAHQLDLHQARSRTREGVESQGAGGASLSRRDRWVGVWKTTPQEAGLRPIEIP